ncbi:MAG: hypothetical protein MK194_12895 [Roseibacillus sp.]|nr:hypothetical protein [Roseibacillus sp.]
MSNTATNRPVVRLVSKPRATHPNHHLFNNNGIWWCQLTVHHGPFSKRLRFSLETHDLEQARSRRDNLFAQSEGRAAA